MTCLVHPLEVACNPKLLDRLRPLSTSLVSDSMERVGGMQGVHPISTIPYAYSEAMVGQALTVRTAAGDNLTLHQALEFVTGGEVIAVAAGGHTERAITGEIMVKYAHHRGAVGLVVDGAIRDADSLRRGPMPVFAAGVNHLGPYKNGPGEIGGTVSMGGTVVRQGDVLMGDCDGVVVIRPEVLEEVVERAEQKGRDEAQLLADIDEDRYATGWLADRLTVEHVPASRNGSAAEV